MVTIKKNYVAFFKPKNSFEAKWLEPKKLPEVIVDFKKNLYLKLLKEINLVIG